MKHLIKYLEWDSTFFKIKVGEIIADNKALVFDREALSGYDLIYVKSKKESDYNITGFKNSCQETKVIFSKNLVNNNANSSDVIFEYSDITQINKLYELAFESGKNSRFRLDSKFTIAQFKAFYKTWIDNSINKTFADGILVCKIKGEIIGFATYSCNKDEAKIGLIGVDSKFQNQGIGTKLIKAVEHKLLLKNVNRLHITTQLENSQACNFYKHLGYSIISEQIIKHYWKI
jgi:ribosomal protein S18 acetylase RimI-like enzyme